MRHRIDDTPRLWHTPAFAGIMPELGGSAMTRGVWAALVVCAVGSGCMGPQYYTPAPEQLPQPANVNGTMVQITDQRPEWEKKPFTGKVCLYDLGKSHPNAWAQLSEEVNAIIAELPQKPERAEVVVTSFRIVRNPE